ncbi:relaxase/mobilization nuclease [Mucilaginibacter conchicola]|uniref:Relaxase/mobilization nuclease n=1 Tax=Mucilaginibacter conchicola TaxID=2303333 RepID=A0A372NNU8_9SPHI|nr:relaxase/mobilization nuclease domain-containing protein [Mucilaginibacter conchicola]RFZ89913.1 relaxase/mobilization nuclease [Mucilaginibacter conchicola]
MIAIQKIGRSFMGALKYNVRKLNHPDAMKRAELLDTNFTNLDLTRIKTEVDFIRQLRPNLNRYVYHTSLNFPNEDIAKLDNATLTAIARDYIEAMGFTDNQYFVFRHYDAEHPHLHLLANRICFDGSVVSDSNNYVRSEEAIRALEQQYNLVTVEPSNKAAERAPTKDEVEMVRRTNKAPDKVLLQMLLKDLLSRKPTMQQLLNWSEQAGIHFLFNQASTGRISGVTYFFRDFKVKGQSLGNRYKWAELVKQIDYDQVRDSAAIAAANVKTKEKYGELPVTAVKAEVLSDVGVDDMITGQSNREEMQIAESIDIVPEHHPVISGSINISDDIDDEAILGRNRRRQQKAGRNSR